jgi:hypothetical protein
MILPLDAHVRNSMKLLRAMLSLFQSDPSNSSWIPRTHRLSDDHATPLQVSAITMRNAGGGLIDLIHTTQTDGG